MAAPQIMTKAIGIEWPVEVGAVEQSHPCANSEISMNLRFTNSKSSFTPAATAS